MNKNLILNNIKDGINHNHNQFTQLNKVINEEIYKLKKKNISIIK